MRYCCCRLVNSFCDIAAPPPSLTVVIPVRQLNLQWDRVGAGDSALTAIRLPYQDCDYLCRTLRKGGLAGAQGLTL